MDVVAELFTRIQRLPTVPAVAMRVFHELESPHCDLQRVAEIVELDPVISATILRFANTPLWGGDGSCTSVSAAMLRLGTRETAQVMATVGVMNSVPDLPPPFSLAELWMLGLGTAIAARQLCEDLGIAQSDVAYLAGLTHCLGEGLLAVNFADRYRQAIDQATSGELSLDAALVDEFGAPASAVSAHLLRSWQIPEVAQVLEQLHDPESAGPHRDLALVVYTATRMCRTVGIGPGFVGDLDETCLDEVPASFAGRICAAGWSDLETYVLDRGAFLAQVRETVDQAFTQT